MNWPDLEPIPKKSVYLHREIMFTTKINMDNNHQEYNTLQNAKAARGGRTAFLVFGVWKQPVNLRTT